MLYIPIETLFYRSLERSLVDSGSVILTGALKCTFSVPFHLRSSSAQHLEYWHGWYRLRTRQSRVMLGKTLGLFFPKIFRL
jgi:hypothetical protein